MRKIILKGFTLIEMLVVIGIFIIITTVVVSILVVMIRGANKSDSIILVRQNGENAMAQMVRMMRYAKSLDDPESCDGSPQDHVKITSFDLGQTTFSCPATSSDPIASTSAVGVIVYLTNSQAVGVDSCSFVCTQSAVGPPTIGITFTLSKLSLGNTKIPFQSSVTMRNLGSQ